MRSLWICYGPSQAPKPTKAEKEKRKREEQERLAALEGKHAFFSLFNHSSHVTSPDVLLEVLVVGGNLLFTK